MEEEIPHKVVSLHDRSLAAKKIISPPGNALDKRNGNEARSYIPHNITSKRKEIPPPLFEDQEYSRVEECKTQRTLVATPKRPVDSFALTPKRIGDRRGIPLEVKKSDTP